MGAIDFLVTLTELSICYVIFVYAEKQVDGDEDSSNNFQSQGEENSLTVSQILLLCLFSTSCYQHFLWPFVFDPRLKRDVEAFRLNGVRTEATTLLSQSKLDQMMARYRNSILVRFTNTRGQRIEKEMNVDDRGMFLDIERGNLKTLTIYTMPDHPFSASFGDARHAGYSLIGNILYALVGFGYATGGVYCFVIYVTYSYSIAGFVGMLVMHMVMAVCSYLHMGFIDYYPIRTNLYEGGSIVLGGDPTPMLGVSNTVTSAGQGGYYEMTQNQFDYFY
jgi:hypothetical protein